MKVLGIVGSPRKGGNTDILVREVLKGASARGAETEIVYLNDLIITPCQGCDHCKKGDSCVKQDDMQGLYEKIRTADAMVVGSPIYMAHVTAQVKLMIDRMYAFFTSDFKSRLPSGKKAVLLTVQGDGDRKSFESAVKSMKTGFEWLGIDVAKTMVGAGLDKKGAVTKRKDLLTTAFELGSELVTSKRTSVRRGKQRTP